MYLVNYFNDYNINSKWYYYLIHMVYGYDLRILARDLF